MKYILISGGNISGLGKGTCSSSLGHLLQLYGLDVTMIKIDPYLNIDAGTMNPLAHGEVYVTDDGTETDLDIGNYERFLNIRLSGLNNITTGKVYQAVLNKERKGEYLGQTVQIVPHITNEILSQIKLASSQTKVDVCIIELGGTVGDLESSIFLEALRQLRIEHKEDFCHIHVTLVPIVGEQKSKPTQHSFKELSQTGLSPDFIFCRCEKPVEQEIIDKISLFCMVPKTHVISVHNVISVYHVPNLLAEQKVPNIILQKFNIKPTKLSVSEFDLIQEHYQVVKIAIVGKYTKLQDAYLSLTKALFHSCNHIHLKLELIWVNPDENLDDIKLAHGIIVPGGFGSRGTEGKLKACRYARENNIPFLGICFGFQLALIEYYRNVFGIEDANTEEITGNSNSLFVKTESKELGGTMIKGLKKLNIISDNSDVLVKCYKDYPHYERFRHRYVLNINRYKIDNNQNLYFPIISKESGLCAFNIGNHPFYVGVQYHPEYLSRLVKPHPIFTEFILSSFLNGCYV